MSAAALVRRLLCRGFSLSVANGSLRVSPASSLTAEDREAIRAALDDILAALAQNDPWDQGEAIRLMHQGDSLVERLGVSGLNPEVQRAAAGVDSAYCRQDMHALRLAMAEFTLVVERLGAGEPRTVHG